MCNIIDMRKFTAKSTAAAILFLSVFLTALHAEARQPSPLPVPSECYCSECGMSIRAEGLKFTSEVIFQSGKAAYFCDLGDLFVYYEVLKNKQDVATIYVRDYPTGDWAEARSCSFIAGSGVATPMRYGIIAFKDKAGALKFKKEKGRGDIYTFDGILASKLFKR